MCAIIEFCEIYKEALKHFHSTDQLWSTYLVVPSSLQVCANQHVLFEMGH